MILNPFKHVVIDNAFDHSELEMILVELDQMEIDDKWYKYDNAFEKKRAKDQWWKFPPNLKRFFQKSFEPIMIESLETMFEIKGLCCDPYLRGAGIHWIETDGKLDVHKDFTKHPHLGLIRRLNAILYLNHSYKESYGGQLELWDKEMTSCVSSIEPIFNRFVLFETPDAPHGHPKPWKGPKPRRSLSLYYYTAPTIEDLNKTHLSTQFLKKPNEPTTPEIEELRKRRNQGRLNG